MREGEKTKKRNRIYDNRFWELFGWSRRPGLEMTSKVSIRADNKIYR